MTDLLTRVKGRATSVAKNTAWRNLTYISQKYPQLGHLGHRVYLNIILFVYFPIENYACPEVLRTLISQNDQHICIPEVKLKKEIRCTSLSRAQSDSNQNPNFYHLKIKREIDSKSFRI